MSDRPDRPRRDDGLNPALKSRVEKTHNTDARSPSPVESASVQREEGRAWPAIWLGVTILCALILVYLLV